MGKRHHGHGPKKKKLKKEPSSSGPGGDPKKKVISPAIWENLKPERPEVLEHLREMRKGKKTLCIVGTSPDNCNLAPWGEGLDMWGVNDGHRLAFMDPHINEMTGWFQMHHRWRWMISREISGSERLRYGTQHYKFITDPNLTMPVWMQRQYEDVPRSVKFPLREISEQLFYKKIERGMCWQRKYFTCSFGFMMGLALADIPGFPGPYERVELYGVQLAQQIEYQMQKPNTEFWIGLAIGRGVEIYVPENGYLLSGETYGYRLPHGNPSLGQIDEENVGYWDWGDKTHDMGYRGEITWG